MINRSWLNLASLIIVAIGILSYCEINGASLTRPPRVAQKPSQFGRSLADEPLSDSLNTGYCGNFSRNFTKNIQARSISCDEPRVSTGWSRVINEQRKMVELSAFPSFALLTFASTSNFSLERICGGVVIDKDRIITAAQCVIDRHNSVQVLTGITDLDVDLSHQQVRYGHTVCLLDGYKPRDMINDIAIIQVNRPFVYDQWTQPACLELDRAVPSDVCCWSLGFGQTAIKRSKPMDRKLYMMGMRPSCRNVALPPIDTRSHRCWRSTQASSWCRNDAGSPIICMDYGGLPRHHVVGLVSFGPTDDCVKKEGYFKFYSDTHSLKKELRELLKKCHEYQ